MKITILGYTLSFEKAEQETRTVAPRTLSHSFVCTLRTATPEGQVELAAQFTDQVARFHVLELYQAKEILMAINGEYRMRAFQHLVPCLNKSYAKELAQVFNTLREREEAVKLMER